MEIKFFKRFNPLKRKQKDSLVASALIRLDTNLIMRNTRSELLNVDLVETVDFHIEEALKTKFQTILQESKAIFSKEDNLKTYLGLKYKKETCCCCFDYRSLSNRREYQEFKKTHNESIFCFKAFCSTYGPFRNKDEKLFGDIRILSDEYQVLKQEYDKKEVTIPEILGTLSFDMDLLRTEEDYLRVRRLCFDHEIKHNDFEGLYLKEKLLHLYRLWGTLGVIDSLNFFKNFSVCVKTYIGLENNPVEDNPLNNLQKLKDYGEIGLFSKELFIWLPKVILLMAILISFCRADFFTVIVFAMIGPMTKFRWRLEHYYSAIFAIFWIIWLDIFW